MAASSLALGPLIEACGGTSSSGIKSVTVSDWQYGYGNPDTTLAGFIESLWPQYAQKHGVTMTASVVAPEQANQIFASGRVNLLAFSPTTVVNLNVAGGGKGKVIVGTQPINDYVIVANRNKVPTIKDIAGKTFGISAPGTISLTIPQLAFQKNGVDFQSAGVKTVPVGGSSARVTALLSGKVDAAGLYHDDAINVLHKDPKMFILLDTSIAVPFVFSSAMVQGTMLTNADDKEGLIQALVGRGEMLKWVVTSKDDFVNHYMAKFPQADRSVIADAYDQYIKIKMWDPDMVIDQKAYEQTLQIGLSATPPLVQGNLAFKEWVDTSFRDEAIRRLGGTGWWKK
jgi:NitT/TauT family transport system substrate-binding protein